MCAYDNDAVADVVDAVVDVVVMAGDDCAICQTSVHHPLACFVQQTRMLSREIDMNQ